MRFALLAGLMALCLLSACGKKPDVMEAPEGADPNAYPRHYPDVITDPQGVYILPKQLEK
jgi:hypothetical protein